jgi:tRNA(Ile)-lysidine synthase
MSTHEADLREALARFWSARQMEGRLSGKLVVGVSGGADSLALLHLLVATAVSPLEHLTAVYVDHGLRDEAGREAQFVVTTAEAWGVSALISHVDTRHIMAELGLSLETAARFGRYRALVEVARHIGAETLVVAHTADDQAETVLMHLLRGSGLAGLRGMLPLSQLSADLSDGREPIWVARPLLGVWREQIELYCQAVGLTPVQDETNRDLAFTRNAIRHQVMPYLAQFNPHIKERLGHTAEIVAADYAVLDGLTADVWRETTTAVGEGWVRFNRTSWCSQPVALQRRLLRRAIAQVTAVPVVRDVNFATLEQAREHFLTGTVGGEAPLPQRIRAVIEYETLLIAHPFAEVPEVLVAPQLASASEQTMLVPGETLLADGWRLQAEWVDRSHVSLDTGSHEAFLALAPRTVLRLRGRLAGERFTPLGMTKHTVKLKDLMIDRKIPAGLRARWPLVVDDEGVLWVVGHNQAERTAVRPDSPTVLKLTLWAPAKQESEHTSQQTME